MRIGLGLAENTGNRTLYRMASAFLHPLAVCSARQGSGSLPLDSRLLTVDGNVCISTVKKAEDSNGIIIRLSDESGEGSEFTLTFASVPSAAFDTDINENIRSGIEVQGNSVRSNVKPFAVRTVLVIF